MDMPMKMQDTMPTSREKVQGEPHDGAKALASMFRKKKKGKKVPKGK